MTEIIETEASWEELSGRGDPAQRFQIRRLCECSTCEGAALLEGVRCPECRGEGRVMELVATAGTPEAMGTALTELARKGEFEDCPPAVLDVMGEKGQKWIVRPWGPSPRNWSDAGRVLASAPRREQQ